MTSHRMHGCRQSLVTASIIIQDFAQEEGQTPNAKIQGGGVNHISKVGKLILGGGGGERGRGGESSLK